MKGSVAALVTSKFRAKPTYDLHVMQSLILKSGKILTAGALQATPQISLKQLTQLLREHHKQNGKINWNISGLPNKLNMRSFFSLKNLSEIGSCVSINIPHRQDEKTYILDETPQLSLQNTVQMKYGKQKIFSSLVYVSDNSHRHQICKTDSTNPDSSYLKSYISSVLSMCLQFCKYSKLVTIS